MFYSFLSAVNEFIWGKIGLFSLIGTGVFLTLRTGFFQVRFFPHALKCTVGKIYKNRKSSDTKNISPFQAVCTALAATIGTGNIIGVSAAIIEGGAGAVFWMWIAAFFGMMTSFFENTLGIYYRKKGKNGEWLGGAMYYLKFGLGAKKKCKMLGKILAVLFSVFTIFASFGIGNIGQVNKITLNLKSAFLYEQNFGKVFGVPISSLLIGVLLMVFGGIIIFGGLRRIAVFAEKAVPIMCALYFLFSVIIILLHIENIGSVFILIFKSAFKINSAKGGFFGFFTSKAFSQGVKRGVFSNEAGLGSTVIINSSSSVKEPTIQGFWGIFEVFFDTFIVSGLTALVVISSGKIDLNSGLWIEESNDATLVSDIFYGAFGVLGKWFICISILFFAFTTLLGWSQYGARAVEYLLGKSAVRFYLIAFVLAIFLGAIVNSSTAWEISDAFNGLMIIPNLLGVLLLYPEVIKITENYISRKFLKKHLLTPMLSAFSDIQNEQFLGMISDNEFDFK